MRTLIALFACCLVITTASANDPPANTRAPGAAVPAAALPVEPAKVVPARAKPVKLSAAALRAQEEQAEIELSAKIAARLAEMRATQAARIAGAAKARKVAEARKRAAAVAASAPPPKVHGTHWSYEGESGPANWSKINSDWLKCSAGNRQSPIDIRDGMKVDLEQIAFDYKASAFNVVDNGHTIQVTVGAGNFLTVQGRSYELMQFHFHRPSEERINGRGFEMVVHLVHKDVEGRIAVLAVLLERGKANEVIQTVWNNLPLEKHDVVVPSIVLDVNGVLPAKHDYYTYMGSLTEPPCTEGVLWLVMKQPMAASPAQMALFSRLYPLNARPIQANAGRVIKESQ